MVAGNIFLISFFHSRPRPFRAGGNKKCCAFSIIGEAHIFGPIKRTNVLYCGGLHGASEVHAPRKCWFESGLRIFLFSYFPDVNRQKKHSLSFCFRFSLEDYAVGFPARQHPLCVCGVMVSISAFRADDAGSIPVKAKGA